MRTVHARPSFLANKEQRSTKVETRMTLDVSHVIFQNERECFTGVSKHEKTDESPRSLGRTMYISRICFSVNNKAFCSREIIETVRAMVFSYK